MGTQLVPGSLASIAQQSGQSLAQSFMSADVIVMVDTSGSMAERDVLGEVARTRYQAACDELTKLQAQYPGKVAVISFSDSAAFCSSGVPTNFQLGTKVASALRYIRPADDCGMTFVLVSDGEPQDADEALALARTFVTPIQAIFIGTGPGRAFLDKIAETTGGTSTTKQIPQLSAHIAGLLVSR